MSNVYFGFTGSEWIRLDSDKVQEFMAERTKRDGIPRHVAADGRIMKNDWVLNEDVEDLHGESLEEHIERLLTETG